MKSYLRLFFLILIIFFNLGTLYSNSFIEARGNPIGDTTNLDSTFAKVEVEAVYPGGPQAWQRYLLKNLRYPDEAAKNSIQGDVMVNFIVDKQGNISEIRAISGPNELREEAVRLIKASGKWAPGIFNGHQVKSYKNQVIKWRLS